MINTMSSTSRRKVMHLLTTLDMGGAERLSLAIIDKNREHFQGIIAGMYGDHGDLSTCAKSMDIEPIALDMKGGRLQSIISLYKALKKYNISLLHVQAGYLLLYAFPAAKLAGIPIIYTEHALNSIKKYKNIRLGIRLFSKFLDGISCVNEEIKNYFTHELAIPSNKIEVIENGVDTKVFTHNGIKAKLPWSLNSAENNIHIAESQNTAEKNRGDIFVFGTVARLTQAKDHPNLLNAFSILSSKYPQTRLLMVGDGEEREKTEQLIQNLNIGNKVHITGKSLNIPEYLRSMDCFVMSSQREGLPVAILEAMACALPVISTDVGSIKSLDDSKNPGSRLKLVPAQNSEAFAKAMEEVLLDAKKREELSQNAQSYVLAEKSDISMAKKYLDLYAKGGFTWG